MTKPVVLDSFSWPTQSAAEAAFRDILRGSYYDEYEPISDPVHDKMLRELLERHPEVSEKSEGGVDYFFIGRTRDGNRPNVRKDATGIWIARVIGDPVDFSYRTAIKGHSPKSDVKDALRGAVEDLRFAFRDMRFLRGPVLSDLSGAEVQRDDAQVIYLDPTWAQLAFRFVELEGGWDSVEIHSGNGGVAIGTQLRSDELRRRWRKFHLAHARLGIASTHEAATRPRSNESDWRP